MVVGYVALVDAFIVLAPFNLIKFRAGIRGANDASRARVQLSSTRIRKLESELDSSSKARELEK